MRNTLAGIVLLATLSLVACNKGGPPPAKDVIVEALKQPNVVILDVRSPDEFAGGHVEGAINVPVAEVGDRIEAVVPEKDRQIIVHCAAGVRSAKATSKLEKMGYQKILDAKNPDAVAKALGKPLVK